MSGCTTELEITYGGDDYAPHVLMATTTRRGTGEEWVYATTPVTTVIAVLRSDPLAWAMVVAAVCPDVAMLAAQCAKVLAT